MTKKAYKRPIIKQVPLDPSQALLQACVVGGAYFGWATGAYSSSKCAVKGGSLLSCGISVKGTMTNGAGDGSSQMIQESPPS